MAERDALKAEIEGLKDPAAVRANILRGNIVLPSEYVSKTDEGGEYQQLLAVCRRIVDGWDSEETVWVGVVEDASAAIARAEGRDQRETTRCPDCEGRGYVASPVESCLRCNGVGQASIEEPMLNETPTAGQDGGEIKPCNRCGSAVVRIVGADDQGFRLSHTCHGDCCSEVSIRRNTRKEVLAAWNTPIVELAALREERDKWRQSYDSQSREITDLLGTIRRQKEDLAALREEKAELVERATTILKAFTRGKQNNPYWQWQASDFIAILAKHAGEDGR